MENKQFLDNKTFKNIEIAAGCGNFGKLYYDKCYLTDKDTNLEKICKVRGLTCEVDLFCDANNLPWSDNRFERIIICNPFGFGFNEDESATLLLDELVRVSKQNKAKIILFCSKNNKYCNPERVKKRVNTYLNSKSPLQIIVEIQDLDTQKEYPNYTFYTSDGKQTLPHFKITLYVSK